MTGMTPHIIQLNLRFANQKKLARSAARRLGRNLECKLCTFL
jgi:hypothetical protein